VESKYFLSKVILFSGAERFTLSDHNTRAVTSPTQPGEGKKISGGGQIFIFFPNFDDN